MSVIGILVYISSNAHPDIQFSVHQCARFSHIPLESHEESTKHIFRYLQVVKVNGLIFQPKSSLELDLYINDELSGLWNYEDNKYPVFVKYITVYVLTLGGFPISWSSKFQNKISISTTEADHIELSQAMQDLIPMCCLLLEISNKMNLGDG